MIISKQEIIRRGFINPCNEEYASSPTAFDMQIGGTFISPTPIAYQYLGEKDQIIHGSEMKISYDKLDVGESKIKIKLAPGQLLLCHSSELYKLPSDAMGLLSVRSSYARKWLDHSGAIFIHPGFSGTITYEFQNKSTEHLVFTNYERIMQIVFMRVSDPANLYCGRYQGQDQQLEAIEDEPLYYNDTDPENEIWDNDTEPNLSSKIEIWLRKEIEDKKCQERKLLNAGTLH
jgi:deoxycytidine triphosphate deaminase